MLFFVGVFVFRVFLTINAPFIVHLHKINIIHKLFIDIFAILCII